MKRNLEEKFPEIAAEWHPTKNRTLTPRDVVARSGKKYWFQCSTKKESHDYEARLHSKTCKNPTGCPYCANRKISEDNCLQTLFKKVSSEWHPTKNGMITPRDVVPGSNKKYWFQCEKKHEWKTNLRSRTLKNIGCPYCSNKKASKENCLKTLFEKVASEWHPTKNGTITPRDVVPSSHKKYWFQCGKKHVWPSSLKHRTSSNSECPYCSNKKVSKENCLETLFPEIAKEWHPTKNGILTPRDVVARSGKKYWFRCPIKKEDHDYETSLRDRTNKKCGCPYCKNKTQEKVRAVFEKLLTIPFPKYRPKFLERMEFDGANLNLKLAFEYDGEFHDIPHYASKDPEKDLNKTKELDAKKNRLCKENGWTLIRVHHSKKNRLESYIIEELKKLKIDIKNV